MKKIIFFTLALFLGEIRCDAQDWIHILNDVLTKSPAQIQVLPGGDLLICGDIGPKMLNSTHSALLMRLHPDGTILWQKQIGGVDSDGNFTHQERLEDLAVTEQGEIVAVGYRNALNAGAYYKTDVLVVKTDLNGNVLWQRYYDWSPSDNGMGIAALSDGGLAICGNTLNVSTGDLVAFVLKTDAEGDVMWKKEFNFANMEDWLYKVIETHDHMLVAAGTSQLPGTGNRMMAVKLDSNGNISWQKTYDEHAINARSVVEGNGGRLGFAGMGYESATSLDNLIVETDAEGEVLWEKNYHAVPGGVPDQLFDLVPCAEGGYVAAGLSGANPFDGYYVLHVNGNGTPVHTFALYDNLPDAEWAVSLAHAPNGKVVVIGAGQNSAWTNDLILSQYSGLGCTLPQAVKTQTVYAPEYAVFPNPADAFFRVRAPEHSGRIVQFSLSDMSGAKRVCDLDTDTDELRVPCSHLPEGCYTYLLTPAGGQVVSGKIVIKH